MGERGPIIPNVTSSLFDGDLTLERAKEVMRLANIIYFRSQVWDRTYWMGINIAKCPMDLIVYQELLVQQKPDYIIETGTLRGGSALYFAQLGDLVGNGRIISIDIEKREGLPQHPRIEYIESPSTDPSVVAMLDSRIKHDDKVLVILDADHRAEHVSRELELYSRYVSVGSYLIVEDSCFDGFPAWPEYGPGPTAAIDKFIEANDSYQVDYTMERHFITFSPKGFLKRVR